MFLAFTFSCPTEVWLFAKVDFNFDMICLKHFAKNCFLENNK